MKSSRRPLLREERLQNIMDILEREGKVLVEELADKFNVTTETVRRDLDALQKEKRLTKVHGGAVKSRFIGFEPSFVERNTKNINEKIAVGKTASLLVEDNDIIFIDLGTTTQQIIHFIELRKNLTVLTNSISALNSLIKLEGDNVRSWNIYFTGGAVNRDIMGTVGSLAYDIYSKIFVDKAFLGASGVSVEFGISDYNIEAISFSKKMLDNSKESYILIDNSKIDLRGFYKLADLEEIDGIVCDRECPESWEEKLSGSGVEWYSNGKKQLWKNRQLTKMEN